MIFYWVSSSNNLSVEYNTDFLYGSLKLDSTGVNNLFTTKSIEDVKMLMIETIKNIVFQYMVWVIFIPFFIAVIDQKRYPLGNGDYTIELSLSDNNEVQNSVSLKEDFKIDYRF